MAVRTRYDFNDLYQWDVIEDTFDDYTGDLIQRTTQYDNGGFRDESFAAGNRMFMVHYDGFGGPQGFGAYDWERIETSYDFNGRIELRTTFFDDGGVRDEQFMDGIRTMTFRVDGNFMPGGSHDWDYVETTYGYDGQIEMRMTTYDDGSVREESFQDGLRQNTWQYDPNFGPDGQDWDTIFTSYDFQGRMERRETTFDDGSFKEELFVDGARDRIYEVDAPGPGGKRWDVIETVFDFYTGDVIERVTTNDNGSVETERFTDGRKTDATLWDGADLKGWDTIDTIVDYNGKKLERIVSFDDGRISTDQFDGGVRWKTHMQEDPYGGRPWSDVFVFYDGRGKVESRLTVYDDGDAMAQFFANGRLYQKVLWDGDDSEDWSGRVTDYDGLGTTVSDYFLFDGQLPSEFYNLPELPPELFNMV